MTAADVEKVAGLSGVNAVARMSQPGAYLTRPGTRPQLAMAQLKAIAQTILSRW